MKPYIVSSRKSKILLQNLLSNDFPILFDGLHTTYYINHPSLLNRRKFVRAHNIEHLYYNNLAKHEPDLSKKIFYKVESFRLKLYEKLLRDVNCLFPISVKEHEYFRNKYHNSELILPFHPFADVECLPGFGDYILYHGDLSVIENAIIVNSLIDNVFSQISCQCIIAGKNPSEKLVSKASGVSNIQIISNPDNYEMSRLIRNAQIQILPALTANGFKIKLLLALYSGRHCLINSVTSEGTGIRNLCHIADSSEELINQIQILMQKRFTEEMIQERQKVLSEIYNNKENAEKLVKLIFGEYYCY